MIKKTFSKAAMAVTLAVSSSLIALPTIASVDTPITSAKQALENESYILAANAYMWGSTLVRMEQIARQYSDVSEPQVDTSYRGPLNEFGHARRLSTPADTDMPTANRDTLYSSAVLDLSQGPMVLSVPDVNDRYFVINMFDMWHNLFQYVGTRETGQLAKQFLLVPPGWKSDDSTPRELTIVEAPTSKVWLWGRTQVFDDQDYPAAHAVQDQYKLTSLAQYQTGQKPVTQPLPPRAGDENDPLRFFVELGEYLKQNPVDERNKAMLGQFKKIGLTKNGFNDDKLSLDTKKTLIKAIEDGHKMVLAQQANPANLEFKDGWVYTFALDAFGDDSAMRSLIAHPYLGGQGPQEAIYPMAAMDTKGNPLSGETNYVMHFDKEPPVGAFWSVTVYDAETKMLVDNSINRYNISSLSDLKKNKDGSFDIQFSSKQPADAQNWLPTPEGNFYVLTRLYVPSKQVLNMDWTVPGLNAE